MLLVWFLLFFHYHRSLGKNRLRSSLLLSVDILRVKDDEHLVQQWFQLWDKYRTNMHLVFRLPIGVYVRMRSVSCGKCYAIDFFCTSSMIDRRRVSMFISLFSSVQFDRVCQREFRSIDWVMNVFVIKMVCMLNSGIIEWECSAWSKTSKEKIRTRISLLEKNSIYFNVIFIVQTTRREIEEVQE